MPSNPGAKAGRTPQPIGYRRKGFPEFCGWADVVRISERTDTSVRQMRNDFPREFPEPVTVLTATPVYLADEVRAFFAKHPRRALIDDDTIRQIQSLIDGGNSQRRVAELLDLNVNTVNKYANTARI